MPLMKCTSATVYAGGAGGLAGVVVGGGLALRTAAFDVAHAATARTAKAASVAVARVKECGLMGFGSVTRSTGIYPRRAAPATRFVLQQPPAKARGRATRGAACPGVRRRPGS